MQSSHFDPWGNRMSASDWTSGQSGTDFSFHRGFTGHEHYDRFGIINMNARLYDPVIGRFFSPDPQVHNHFSTQGINRKSYCGNNPVMYSDPDGEFALLLSLAMTYATIVGGINLGIHISQGDVHNAGQAIGYMGQGVVAGVTLGFMQCAGLYAMTTPLAPLYAGAGTANIITTVAGMFGDTENAWRIFCGNFYFDENMAHGFSQAITRFTTEMLQSWAGYNFTQIRNASSHVDRVDYLGGATFATDEFNGNKDEGSWGISIGHNVNISLIGEINTNFRDFVSNDQLYMHEYGHTIQSQLYGSSYLFAIGIPSLISAARSQEIPNDPINAYTHDYFVTEYWANRWAAWYFNTFYDYTWHEFWRGNAYPLNILNK